VTDRVNTQQVSRILEQTLADGRLTGGERKALKAVFADLRPDHRMRSVYAAKAREAAIEALADPRDRHIVEWLTEVLSIIRSPQRDLAVQHPAEAWFSPQGGLSLRIASLLESARTSIDICVFTITDDRVAAAISDSARRGINVRIVTDDEKSMDRGSDIERFVREGIPVRMDDSPDHMHNKFAIIDRTRLMTGSYNWTYSADKHNQENVIVTSDPILLTAFIAEFEKLWRQFAR
jgi:phosphatidylserine/phosphatidylglycerophosphate/cardiolipin synthase-like enzyme